MTDENLRLFLQRFREFNAEIEARKKRGQNNFNPLLYLFFFLIIIRTHILHLRSNNDTDTIYTQSVF